MPPSLSFAHENAAMDGVFGILITCHSFVEAEYFSIGSEGKTG